MRKPPPAQVTCKLFRIKKAPKVRTMWRASKRFNLRL